MKATMAWRCRACDDLVKDYLCVPFDPNQPDVVHIIPEPVLVDEDEDPEEEEFKEEEEPQEEEEDMDIDDDEDENEPELTFPYEEADPLNPPPPASDSELEDVIEVEDTVEPEDETVPASVHEVGESSTAYFLQKDSDGMLPGLMRRDINSFFGRMTSLSRRLCGREMAHALFKKKGKAKDEYYGKLILDLGNGVRSSMEEGTATMENQVENLNERVKIDLYWTRVRAHEFYREMIRRGFVFEERPNEAIDVLVEDEESPSFEPRGSFRDSYLFLCDITEHASKVGTSELSCRSAIDQIKFDAAIPWPPFRKKKKARARPAKGGNNDSRSGQARGQVTTPVVQECTFDGFMKCNPDNFRDKKVKFVAATLRGPTLTWWNSKVAILGLDVANQMGWIEMKKLMTAKFCPAEELQRMENELWNLKVKEYNMVAYTQIFNELALMCPRMVEPESVKVDAYIRGLTDNIKGEVTSSKPTNLNKAVCMAHKLMEQKLQARNERILE
ncbi:putative reverse transcriptase domain-containing protein [Tanacetum coccineum]